MRTSLAQLELNAYLDNNTKLSSVYALLEDTLIELDAKELNDGLFDRRLYVLEDERDRLYHENNALRCDIAELTGTTK